MYKIESSKHLFYYLLIDSWLCLAFIAVPGLSQFSGFSWGRAWAPGQVGSVVVVYRLSCPVAHEIFLDQGLSPWPLRWLADSLPLDHQGSPEKAAQVMGDTWEGGGCWTHLKDTNWGKEHEKASFKEVADLRITHSPWLHERDQMDAAPYSKSNDMGCLQRDRPELDLCPMEVVCVCVHHSVCIRQRRKLISNTDLQIEGHGVATHGLRLQGREGARSTSEGCETCHSSRCKDAWTDTCRFLLSQIWMTREVRVIAF